MQPETTRKELLKQINDTLRLIQKDDSPEHTERFKDLSRQYSESYGRSCLGDVHEVRDEK